MTVHFAEAIDRDSGTVRERGEDRASRDVADEDAEALRAKWLRGTVVRVRSVERKRGRPSLGDAARSVVRTIKITPAEDVEWRAAAAAAAQSVNEWIRERVTRNARPGVCTRVAVEPDGESWYWTAYDHFGTELGAGDVEQTDKASVIRCVEGHHGIRVDEDVHVELVRGAVEHEIES